MSLSSTLRTDGLYLYTGETTVFSVTHNATQTNPNYDILFLGDVNLTGTFAVQQSGGDILLNVTPTVIDAGTMMNLTGDLNVFNDTGQVDYFTVGSKGTTINTTVSILNDTDFASSVIMSGALTLNGGGDMEMTDGNITVFNNNIIGPPVLQRVFQIQPTINTTTAKGDFIVFNNSFGTSIFSNGTTGDVNFITGNIIFKADGTTSFLLDSDFALNLTVGADLSVDNNLTVNNNILLTGNLSVFKQIDSTDILTVTDKSFNVNTAVTIQSDLNVDGIATFTQDTSFTSALTVDGNATVGTNLTVQGDSRLIKGVNIQDKFYYVKELNDLPQAVDNVITLANNTTYFITNTLDLGGRRFLSGNNTTLIGASSENSHITSTGLPNNTPLLTCHYSTPVRFLAFTNVHTALLLDRASGLPNTTNTAFDWIGVNFININKVGRIGNVSNFIFTQGAFLSSNEIIIDGEIDTFAFNNCFFSGDGSQANIITIDDNSAINRRFRTIYSSFVAFGQTTAVNVSTAANIPTGSFILDTIYFSGGSTYLGGVQVTDNKALFINCEGIDNSREISEYYFDNNNVTTTINTIGVPVKIQGATTSSPVTQKFDNTENNTSTYIGAKTRFFKILATISLNGNNNDLLGLYVAKNDNVILSSESYVTIGGTGDVVSAVVQSLVELQTNDNVSIWIENDKSTNNVLIKQLNVIID